MVLHLADQAPGRHLVPKIGETDRARCYQWLFFLSDTIYPSYNRLAHPVRYISDEIGPDLIKENAMSLLSEQWNVVEKSLTDRRWLLGDRFSCADIYLLMVATWDFKPESFAQRCLNVIRVALATAQRSAVQ
jgi:glutathione S-transferase